MLLLYVCQINLLKNRIEKMVSKNSWWSHSIVSNQKNKCLSPKNLYLENAYAAGKAADTEIKVLKTVYVIELTYPIYQVLSVKIVTVII